MRHGRQEGAGGLPVAVDPQVGEGKRAEEPAPGRTLVVGAVALGRSAPVARRVAGIAGCEAAQAERGQELARAGVDDPCAAAPARAGSRAARPRRSGWAAGVGVGARGPIDHVVARAGRLVPEAVEARRGAPGHLIPGRIVPAQPPAREPLMARSALYQSALISTGLPVRGVTTRSPTFASIHVSCTPGSPARSRPSAASTPMP